MGEDKALLAVGGVPIVARVAAAARAVAEPLFLVADEPGPYSFLGLEAVSDIVRGQGALGGILTALTRARTGYCLVLSCDLPFVSARLLLELARQARGRDGAFVVDEEGPHPLCAVYRTGLVNHVGGLIEAGKLRAQDLAIGLDAVRISRDQVEALVGSGPYPLFNVNTPADLTLARRMAGPSPG